jgi:uroporphyrin-III C-methyltransferase
MHTITEPMNTPLPLPKRWTFAAWLLLAFAALLSLVLAWNATERLRKVELEITRRQQDTQTESNEARIVSKQAQEIVRDVAAKVSLLEGRVSEVALQRTQLEGLIQTLSHSRDENAVADIDAGLRIAQQQSTVTGSAEPLVVALKQADERLARYNQPRLETVRRALARDLDRIKAVAVADIASLSIKLDEVVRMVDALPMLSQASDNPNSSNTQSVAATSSTSSAPSAAAPAPKTPDSGRVAQWWHSATQYWADVSAAVLHEAHALVRVTRIDHPDAVLLAPEQAFFVRENLKLRLLNARLALLSRQFETTQIDLQAAQVMLERYFDRSSRRTLVAADLLKQVALAGRSSSLPRPDESLAALAAAAAGR